MFKYILIFLVAVYFAEAIQLRMKFSGKNLPRTDESSAIDPYVVATLVNRSGRKLLGKTTHKKDATNPDWSKVFSVDYSPCAKQKILLELFDKEDGSKDELVSSATLDLDEYLMKNQRIELKLPKGILIAKKA